MSLNTVTRVKLLSQRAELETLVEHTQDSPEAFRQQFSNELLSSEADELYQAAWDARDTAIVHEKCLLTRSSPLLQNAVALGVKTPQGALRDYEDQFGSRASRYTSPGSVSSMFSPAAYLTTLYRNARRLYPDQSPYHIDFRRPDLKELALSQHNMNKVVPALSLSNEVLMAHTREALSLDSDGAVLDHLSTWRLSGGTPYHHAYSRLRQCRTLKDAKFEQMSANPQVAGLFSGPSSVGMEFDISPELYAILTEEVTEENAEALYAKNFGDQSPELLLEPERLRRFYGLSDDEVRLFLDTASSDYVNNLLEVRLGNTFYRLECLNVVPEINFVRLYPQVDGSYKLLVNSKVEDLALSWLNVHVDTDTVLPIARVRTLPHLQAGVTYELIIPPNRVRLNGSIPFSLSFTSSSTGPSRGVSFRYTIDRMSPAAYALKLNKAIRLRRAAGMHPHALRNIVDSVNRNNINDETLQLLHQVQRCVERYGVKPDEALSLCGGRLSMSAQDGELSQFDKLFNNPPIGDTAFVPSGLLLYLAPSSTKNPVEKATLKRALQVDDAGLFALLGIYDKDNNSGFIELNLHNLSRMYSLSRWAQLHALSVSELGRLLQFAGAPRLFEAKSELWMSWLQSVDALTKWLTAQQWSVADLGLMLDTPLNEKTPGIVSLFDALKEEATRKPDALPEEKVALLAPHVAAAFQLPSADIAVTLLEWGDGLKPGGMDIADVWAALSSSEPEIPETAFAFIHGLPQLALFYHASGISPQAFALFVATPERLQGGNAVVLPRTLSTLQGFCGFSTWLKGLGDAATPVLTAFLADTLAPAKLIDALNSDTTTLAQAGAQAVKHGQVNSDAKLSNWAELDAVRQWVALSSAFGVTPVDISNWIELEYAANTEATWTKWGLVTDAFAAGLKPGETASVELALSSALSTALSGALLSPGGNRYVTHGSREDLYQYLLCDNLNGPQVSTSRIAEAIVSLQTFIQRTLSSPEGAVEKAALTSQFFTDWERYNQRYSMWAGAAKLLYYPENYIDPTVRLGQTKMMGEMLQTLGQSQLNTDTIGDAFHTYLNGFEEVANLQVISGYHDNLNVKEGKSYFIGANQSEPRDFYWRSADEGRRSEEGQLAANAWTDWREVGCAPQPWGDCIRPVIYKSRLYLCWLEQYDVTPPDENGDSGDIKKYRYTVKMAYLRYDGNWSTPNAIDVTTQVNGLGLGGEHPGLYCSNYQSETTMPVLLYKKQSSYAAANQPVKRHLLYIYEDMSFAHQPEATTRTFVEYMKHELDTTTTVVMNNTYAQGLQVDSALANRVGTSLLYNVTGEASNIVVHGGASGDANATISLLPKLNVSINSIETTLRSLINTVPEIQATPEFYFCTTGATRYVAFGRANGYMYVLSRITNGLLRKLVIYYRDHTFDTFNPLRTYQALDPSTSEYFNVGVYRDPHPDLEIAQHNSGVWVFFDGPGWPDFIMPNTSAGRILSNPLRPIPAGSVSIEFFDGTNRTSFLASQHVDVPPSFDPENEMAYSFKPLTNIPVKKDWGDRNELLIDVFFKVGGADYAKYTLRLYRPLINPRNVIRLGTTAENAQYMEVGPYRTRLNTLFARQLVERASAGIDTILSYDTQNIQEPKLGHGFYTTLTLPKYNPAVHGDEPWVKVYYTYFFAYEDTFPIWSGTLSPDTFTQVTLFVPRPANGWSISTAHLQISYKRAVNPAISGYSVMFNYDVINHSATVRRPGTLALSKNIVESVTIQNTVPMDFGGANALYFWELFYYTPMMMAQRLLQEQQFILAEQWLRYVWSPSGYVVRGNQEDRFWNVRPLQEDTGWNDSPLKSLDPDAVAQNDPMHYKVATFMRGLDLLIARGDTAYRKLERDSLAEAKVWYSQALNLLGEQSYIENDVDWTEPTLEDASSDAAAARHLAVLCLLCEGKTGELKAMASPKAAGAVEFLPEANEVMQGYWLTLRQRMFNLRHNLTLDGQPLLLPLFAKPADPKALLNAAVAAESGAGAGLAPVDLPLWRFEPMLDSARGLVSQLIQFGNSVQNVLERKDAEALTALLQNQGFELMASSIRLQEGVQQELEAEKSILSQALASARQRLASYTRLYDENINARERSAMDALTASQSIAAGAKIAHMAAAAADLVPNIFGFAAGGSKYGGVANAVGIGITLAADAASISGTRIMQEEAYRRRREEWEIQRNNAQGEVHQVEAQLTALDVRRESAQLQTTYLKTQQGQLQVGLDFLQNKFSNVALYSWMRGRLASFTFNFTIWPPLVA
ncbi:neuraminidase-like domain-containing protein [Pseudomonas sp. TSRC2-2]|uniref:neuraminidase-like domain-containing protein n=1 Tax=unclassified Pseudomonas TaxID=196821 RepID=UPI003CF998F6